MSHTAAALGVVGGSDVFVQEAERLAGSVER